MQAPPRTVNAGKAIFQQALIFGFSLFGFRLLIWALDFLTHMITSFQVTLASNMHLSIVTSSLIVTALFTTFYVLVALVLFFLAGLFAAQRTRKTSSGTLAGLWGGLIYGVLSLALFLITFFAVSLPVYNQLRIDANALFTTGIASTLITALLITGLGAGSLGSLFGGLAGRQKPQRRYYPPTSMQYPYQQPAYAPPLPQQPQGLQCMNCHQWNKPDDLFCSLCGKPLVPEKQHCPNCKAELRSGATFCTKCGTTIQQPSQQQKADDPQQVGVQQQPFPQQAEAQQQPTRQQVDVQQQSFPQQTKIQQQPTGQPER